MIKAIQHTIKTSDPTYHQLQALGENKEITELCTIKFENHPLLTEQLMSHLSGTMLKALAKVIPQHNEDINLPTEAEKRRAEATTRQIIRKLGMEPR